MRQRDLVLGSLLVAAMATAVAVARGRGGTDHLGVDLPDLSQHDARLEVGGVAVTVEAARPIRALAQSRLLFRFEQAGGQPLAVEEAVVSFTMRMDMGPHRYSLVPAFRPGWLQAEFVLPACPSGNRRWYGILAFTLSGRPLATRFRFDLEPRPD
ncbi:MAG: hypothetical protein AB1505_34550 [Candidatus Latescibacterota bacterium]